MLFHKTLGYYGHIIDVVDDVGALEHGIDGSYLDLSDGNCSYKAWDDISCFFVVCPD